MESARRKLTRYEQELWNFIAAQLQLHSGYLIEQLPTVEHVINTLQEFKSVLYEDALNLYQSKRKAERADAEMHLQSILVHIKTNLTRLFDDTLNELRMAQDRNDSLASQISEDAKLKIRFSHIKVQSLLNQLMSLTNHVTESMELGDKLRQKLFNLQNPRNCLTARKLLCDVCRDHRMGVGATLHHIGLCLVTAYLSNRTMILDCSSWAYSSKGWDSAFLPITNCTLQHIKDGDIAEIKSHIQLIPDVLSKTQTIRMKQGKRSEIFPPAVPMDIFDKIHRFHSDPPAWWFGQFILWVSRLKEEVARDVEAHCKRQNVTGTIVGKVQSLLNQLMSLTNHVTESMELGDKLRQKLFNLQNPRNCLTARKLLCDVCRDHRMGVGATLHHIGLCLVTAYLSNRTMILDCSSWAYSSKGWDSAFLPITNCTLQHIKDGDIAEIKSHIQLIPDVLSKTQTIRMKQGKRSEIFPPAVPMDIFDKIHRFHSDPPAWWFGQFILWVSRLKEEVARDVEAHCKRQNVTGTIVGLHVRRTDKKREAQYHTVDEYMVHVAEWYDTFELANPNVDRKVYLATDEPSVIEEAIHRYPNYKFIYDRDISSLAAGRSRYSEASLLGVIKDVYSLAG